MESSSSFNLIIDLFNKPSLIETFVDILFFTVPIWLAVMIGVVIGWAWTPRWTSLLFIGFRSKLRGFALTAPPGFGARRLWLAFTALSAFSVGRRMWSNFREKERKEEGDRLDRESVSADVKLVLLIFVIVNVCFFVYE